ncbi:hypothetical protein SDJN03_18546, partial [Cucurbita argyrosperma subsp. sororia]
MPRLKVESISTDSLTSESNHHEMEKLAFFITSLPPGGVVFKFASNTFTAKLSLLLGKSQKSFNLESLVKLPDVSHSHTPTPTASTRHSVI